MASSSTNAYSADPSDTPYSPMRFRELVALLAAIMAAPTLLIDAMLPALPQMAADLQITDPNSRQLIIGCFILGNGVGSLVTGLMADRFGRRPILLIWLFSCLAMTVIGAVAKTFALLIATRIAAGFFAGGCRVVPTSIIRDCFKGDRMARVMSLTVMIFILVPVAAPSIGEMLLRFTNWRGLFAIMAGFGATALIWSAVRLPETLVPQNRVALQTTDIMQAIWKVISHRRAMGYTFAVGVAVSGTFGFVMSIQQVVADSFHQPGKLPWIFAGITIWMAVSSFANSRLVQRLGSRRIGHGALIALMLVSICHLSWVLAGNENLLSYAIFQAMSLFCIPLMASNFNSIAMEPFARGAGVASSLQAFISMTVSASLGIYVGACFDGTTLPIAVGFVCFSTGSFALALWAEQGRLFGKPNQLSRPL